MSKKSKTTQTATIDPVTQGYQRANYNDAVSRFSGSSYSPVGEDDISRYMNPFQQSVIDTSLATLGDQETRALNANRDAALKAKAFGGTGASVADALTRGEYDKNRGSLVAGLNATNYGQAAGMAQTENAAENQYPLLIQQLLNSTLAGVTPNVTTVAKSKSFDPVDTISKYLQAVAAAASAASGAPAGGA